MKVYGLRSRLHRRTFLRTAGVLAGGAALAACSPAATSTSVTRNVADKGVVNILWTDSLNARQPLIADFTAATGIRVNQTQVQYNELFDKINTVVQGGGEVDVIEMDTIWTAQFASAGWIEDLTSRVTEAVTSDIPESALSAVRYQDKLYGMPWFNSAKHLFYNSKLLGDAGFTSPPATLDELVEQAKATTKAGQWGSIWSWKQSEGLICDWVAIMFTQPGAQFFDANGQAVFDQQGGTEAAQWMVDLLYKHQAADPASLESDEIQVLHALETGKIALTYNWEGTLPEANDPAKSQAAPHVKVGLLPGGPGIKSSSLNGSEGWGILKQAANKDAAWALLTYMASPAWQKKAALIAGDYPILASLYSDADLQQNVQDFAIYGEQFQYLAVRPQVPGYAQKSDIIQRHLHAALLQQTTPQEAMTAAASEVNRAASAP
jgi:multiple sugar transport system substrate-binding protein